MKRKKRGEKKPGKKNGVELLIFFLLMASPDEEKRTIEDFRFLAVDDCYHYYFIDSFPYLELISI
jgi:hypothetical protein